MKKGFTLIELLGVFTIMTVIMLVSVPIVTGMMKTAEEQKYENFKNNVFLSAEAYINDHMDEYTDMKTIGGYDYVYFSQLIENDYLNSTVYDPKTGLNVDEELDYTVIATVQDNYTYSYALSTVKLAKDLVVPTIDSLTVNGKVATFTINDNYELQGYYISTTTNIPSLWNTTGSVITYTNSYTALTSGTYYLHVIDYKGNTAYSSFTILPTAFCAYTAGQVWNFAYTGAVQNFTVPTGCAGTYKFELWGASGEIESQVMVNSNGLGSYVKGNINLQNQKQFYVYVGSTLSYNGGGFGEASGGGSTDIRTESTNLYSRIIVAAGGGGGMHITSIQSVSGVGHGGGLIGYSANATLTGYDYTTGYSGSGATQISGGATGTNGIDSYEAGMVGSFGQGGYQSIGRASGGGGGWFGGGHGRHPGGSWPGGGGGSSYISGHIGAVATKSATSFNYNPTCTTTPTLDCSTSYTGYLFDNTIMIDGAGHNWTTSSGAVINQPTQSGVGVQTGNSGNGYAKITLLSLN